MKLKNYNHRTGCLTSLNFQLGKFQWKSIATYSIKLVVTISVISSLLQIGSIPVFAQSDVTVYEKGISSSWRNWSWKSTIDLKNTSVKYSDDVAISFKPNAYGALYLHTDNSVDTTQYKSIQFMLRSTDNDQKLKVIFYDSNNNEIDKTYPLSDFGGSTVAGKWKEYNIPLTKVSGTTKIKGFALQNSGNTAQETVYLDNIYLKGNSTTSTPTTPESTPTAPSSPSTPTTPTSPEVPQPTIPTTTTNVGYTVANGQILKNGSAIKLKGVNWFGFEGGTHVVHGLWLRNYKDMVTQMKTLGFNAVRVPYCPGTLKGVTPTSIDYGRNSDLQGLNSLQVMDKVLGELNNQQMYILLDQHTPDCNAISDLWYTSSYSESSWISDLKMLATRYKNLPYFIGLDLKNEPKGSATWGTGKSTDWNVAAEKAGKEILAANANLLIFVEGIQDNPTCSGNTAHFWGGNLEPVNCKGVNSDYIPANKLVFSPHVYGPDVHAQSYFSASNFPANMPTIWDTHFGFLKDKGYAVVPGEWGGKYGNGGVSSDVTWQNALVSYYKNKKICSSFYWDWNPNSGDTGGILQNDWKTPWQNKVDMLNNFYNSCN